MDRELRRFAKLLEQHGTLRDEVSNAIPNMISVPSLANQDPYKQYRMGVALAAARAADQGLIKMDQESAFGENMVMVAQTDEGARTIELALKLMGITDAKRISTPPSEESNSVNTVSPVAKFHPTKKSRE